ncbi:HlyD family secretion protein [bacterium]|nr:HlyD family secretion protein [bacterium]
MKKTIKITVLLTLLILAAMLTACASQTTDDSIDTTIQGTVVPPDAVIASGTLKPSQAVHLNFQAAGMVENVQVKIGDIVAQGDVLATLANANQAEAQLTAAKLELTNAQQALDTLTRTGDANQAETWSAYMQAQAARAAAQTQWDDLDQDAIQDEIDDLEIDLRDRQDELDDAQEKFNKYADLNENNATRQDAKDALDEAQKATNEAQRALEEKTQERDLLQAALDNALALEAEAQHQWELSADGPNADTLALAQARLENAQAQVAAAEGLLTYYQITAPFSGAIADVRIEAGELAGPEMRAISLADKSSWVVETTDVTELEIVKIYSGQAVTFTADAISGATMNGTVSQISQSAYTQSGDVIYTVTIDVDEVDPAVLWGMTVEVTFEAGE